MGNLGTYLTNYGPCDIQGLFNGTCHLAFGPAYAPSSWTFQFFEIPFLAGVPASEWDRARALVPSLNKAKGGGYSVINNGLLGTSVNFGPADGSLGSLGSSAR